MRCLAMKLLMQTSRVVEMKIEWHPNYWIDYGCSHFWVEYARVQCGDYDHVSYQCVNCFLIMAEYEPVLVTHTTTWSVDYV